MMIHSTDTGRLRAYFERHSADPQEPASPKQWGDEFMGDQERIDWHDALETNRRYLARVGRAGWRCIHGVWKEVC